MTKPVHTTTSGLASPCAALPGAGVSIPGMTGLTAPMCANHERPLQPPISQTDSSVFFQSGPARPGCDGKLRVLIGCEYSGAVSGAFAARGHEVLSADLLPTEGDGAHYHGDLFDVIYFPWDFAGFHFPCTDLSVSGAKHFAAKKQDGRYYAGASLWMRGWRASRHIPGGYFEHPVSVMSSLFRKPDQIVQPWMFGHYETKATCLWLWGVSSLVPTYRTADECREALGLPFDAKPEARIHKMAPGPDRWKERSRTYPGIAAAMAAQWGNTIPAVAGIAAGAVPVRIAHDLPNARDVTAGAGATPDMPRPFSLQKQQ